MEHQKITIRQIELYRVSIPLRKPFVISLGTIKEAANVVVVIRTDQGITGMGECSPFATINGENQDTCMAVGQFLATGLIGKNGANIEECIHLMDKTIYGNSSIKSAFDMALHDVVAQNLKVPLYKLLGGNLLKALVTDYTVSLGEISQMVEDALQIKQNGFTVIKVKLGEDPDKDVERIRKIRREIGKKIKLRVDANQGWTPEEAIKVLNALKDQNIQYCEEPIPRWDFMHLARVRRRSPIPIMADESCFDHHDAERLIGLKACDLFNLKLGKSGGLWKAGQIVTLASKAKMKMQVGGFMESRLGMTANAHLALSNRSILFCDFDTPLMFTSDYVKGGIQYQPGGKILMEERPGLGAWIQEDQLRKFQQVVI